MDWAVSLIDGVKLPQSALGRVIWFICLPGVSDIRRPWVVTEYPRDILGNRRMIITLTIPRAKRTFCGIRDKIDIA